LRPARTLPSEPAGIERGLVRITIVTRLEIGYFARSGTDLREGLRQPPVSAMPVEYLTPAIEDRAVEVLPVLADRVRPLGRARPLDDDQIVARAGISLAEGEPDLPGA
jgi:hypothetical protein